MSTLVYLPVARNPHCSARHSLKPTTTSSPGPSRKSDDQTDGKSNETDRQPWKRFPKIPCRFEDQQEQSVDSFLSKESVACPSERQIEGMNAYQLAKKQPRTNPHWYA